MKKLATFCAVALLGVQALAALPTLSDLAARLEAIGARYEETTNALASTRADLADACANLVAARDTIAKLVALVESRRDLRESYHGGRMVQYVLTNDLQAVRVDFYSDGTVFTNAPVRVALLDPEAAAKAKAAAEARRAEWERSNLPPDIATLLQRRRDAANGVTNNGN